MKNILKLAAALLILSTAASAAPLPFQPPTHQTQIEREIRSSGFTSVSAPTHQTKITLENLLVSSVVHTTARFTPPKFCYIGQVKVACTITNPPPKDPKTGN